jgi:hypothetical protein
MVKKKSHSFYDDNDVISLQEEEEDEDLFSLYQRAHQMQGVGYYHCLILSLFVY